MSARFATYVYRRTEEFASTIGLPLYRYTVYGSLMYRHGTQYAKDPMCYEGKPKVFMQRREEIDDYAYHLCYSVGTNSTLNEGLSYMLAFLTILQ